MNKYTADCQRERGFRKEEKEWLAPLLEDYRRFLENQEKSANTVEKYIRDVRRFLIFAKTPRPDREAALEYKNWLRENYQISSVNSMLMAMNHYLKYQGLSDCCLKSCRQQRRMFEEEKRELSRGEYERLVQEARKRGMVRLEHVLQAIGMTGIRVGELAFLTVEALKRRMVRINFKNKERVILLPKSLICLLQGYCRKQKIKSGSIFITRNGTALD